MAPLLLASSLTTSRKNVASFVTVRFSVFIFTAWTLATLSVVLPRLSIVTSVKSAVVPFVLPVTVISPPTDVSPPIVASPITPRSPPIPASPVTFMPPLALMSLPLMSFSVASPLASMPNWSLAPIRMPALNFETSVETMPLANVNTSAMVCAISFLAILFQSVESLSRFAALVACVASAAVPASVA